METRIKKIKKRFDKLMCRILDHRNDMSCVDKNFVYTNDRCSRCGVDLPIAYPYHKEFLLNRSNHDDPRRHY